jgi:sensor histidine kinase YesM
MNTERNSKLLTTRIVLNVLFWVFAFLFDIAALSTEYNARPALSDDGKKVIFTNANDLFFSLPPTYYLISLSTLVLLAVVVYTNNLLLVPRLLKPKRYAAYIVSALLLVVGMSFAATGFYNAIQYFLPGLPVYDLVFSASFMAREPNIPLQFALHYGQMTIAFTVLWHLYDYVAQRKRLDQAEKNQLQTELNFLKAQINPHFLFNNLNSLYALAIKKSDQTPDAILQLSSLLRYVLYDSNTPQVSFEKEKEIIDAYVQLERLRLADDKDLHLMIGADDNYSIPPLLWLPVLENMFKYGVHALHGDHYGQFIFNISNGWLHLHSRNRFDPQQEKNGAGGIGFRNLQKRLELLYEGKHSFVRGVEGNHYIVDISIDLS